MKLKCFNWKQIIAFCAGIMTLSAFVTFGFNFVVKVDTRWAYSSTVQRIERRVDQIEIIRRLDFIDERLWKLDERYYDREIPISVKEHIRELQKEQKGLELKLQKMFDN